MPDHKKSKKRLDERLVELGLAETTSKAQSLIMAGEVVVKDQRVDKSGHQVSDHDAIRLKSKSHFVGRGGEKMLSIIKALNLSDRFENKVILDIGASTGGFTQCMLEHNAQKVLALDVGSNQLAWKLRQDPRVISIEKTDIRDFTPQDHPKIDWIIGDISFNSLSRLAPYIKKAANNDEASYLLLVKPQFELSKSEVPDGGIIDDPELREVALQRVTNSFAEIGIHKIKSLDSPVKGRNGNQEIFLLLK